MLETFANAPDCFDLGLVSVLCRRAVFRGYCHIGCCAEDHTMFGSHLSVAGGLYKAVVEAQGLGLQTVQIFTRNQQQWASPPLLPEVISDFRAAVAKAEFPCVVAHDSYLTNLAAGNEDLRQKSIQCFALELKRCHRLGIQYLVTHTGAHGGAGEAEGIARIVASLRQVLELDPHGSTMVCLETTAGQGTSLGWRFEHLRDILSGVPNADRLGVCVDTCHIFAAGYDISTAQGAAQSFDEFDRIIGLDRLRVMHVNDSLKPLGSRVDRHAHIGRGMMGLPAFRYVCQHPVFANIPKIMETPKETAPDGRPWDLINLGILQALGHGDEVVIEPFENSAAQAKAESSVVKKRSVKKKAGK
jgi:deoxyribonuclease-4